MCLAPGVPVIYTCLAGMSLARVAICYDIPHIDTQWQRDSFNMVNPSFIISVLKARKSGYSNFYRDGILWSDNVKHASYVSAGII